jgi:hypothetical protein
MLEAGWHMRHREDTAVAGSASQSSRGMIIFPVEIVRLNDDKHLTEMEWLRNGRQERDHNRRIQAGLSTLAVTCKSCHDVYRKQTAN